MQIYVAEPFVVQRFSFYEIENLRPYGHRRWPKFTQVGNCLLSLPQAAKSQLTDNERVH